MRKEGLGNQHSKNKLEASEKSSDLLKKFESIDGKTCNEDKKRDDKRKIIFGPSKDRKLWRAMIAHILEKHSRKRQLMLLTCTKYLIFLYLI